MPGSSEYSVTVTDASGCSASSGFLLSDDRWTLWSSGYVIIAEKDVHLHNNVIFSGGIGVIDNKGKIKFHDGSLATASGTFLKASDIDVKNGSAASVQIIAPADVTLPAFEYNPYCSGPKIEIRDNTTVTLTGSVYGEVKIGKNATVIFTQPDLNIKDLDAKENATVKFAECTRLRLCKKLNLDKHTRFNPDSADVLVYAEDGADIHEGSLVIADIYCLKKELKVHKSLAAAPTVMIGLFIAEKVDADDYSFWHQNTACNRNCNRGAHVAAKTDDSRPTEDMPPAAPAPAANGVLMKAYPNPFHTRLTIEFSLPDDAHVKIEIIGISGQLLATLFEGDVKAAQINKTEYIPSAHSDGVVICRMQSKHGTYFDKAVMIQ